MNVNEDIKNTNKENINNYKTYIFNEINNEENKENINQDNSEKITEFNNIKNNETEDELSLFKFYFKLPMLQIC